jgi:hypothetical protein
MLMVMALERPMSWTAFLICQGQGTQFQDELILDAGEWRECQECD